MRREWKPGDVARLKGSGIDAPAIRTQTGAWAWVDRSGRNPIQGASFAHENWGGEARPLVVIDPEDREQVERLADLFRKEGRCKLSGLHACGEPECIAGRLQAALREFANPTPPKPDEPQGLGAVVEDVDGERWLAVGESGAGLGTYRWARQGRVTGTWCMYADIAAVRVLSEGVTA